MIPINSTIPCSCVLNDNGSAGVAPTPLPPYPLFIGSHVFHMLAALALYTSGGSPLFSCGEKVSLQFIFSWSYVLIMCFDGGGGVVRLLRVFSVVQLLKEKSYVRESFWNCGRMRNDRMVVVFDFSFGHTDNVGHTLGTGRFCSCG